MANAEARGKTEPEQPLTRAVPARRGVPRLTMS